MNEALCTLEQLRPVHQAGFALGWQQAAQRGISRARAFFARRFALANVAFLDGVDRAMNMAARVSALTAVTRVNGTGPRVWITSTA